VVRRLFQWLVPTAPEAIRVEVERRQLASVQQHVPMIYVIATLNLNGASGGVRAGVRACGRVWVCTAVTSLHVYCLFCRSNACFACSVSFKVGWQPASQPTNQPTTHPTNQ
jgi:hypothetical protein